MPQEKRQEVKSNFTNFGLSFDCEMIELSGEAFKLLHFLRRMAGSENKSFWSLTALQSTKLFGCRETIVKSLKELEDKGYILRKKRFSRSTVTMLTDKNTVNIFNYLKEQESGKPTNNDDTAVVGKADSHKSEKPTHSSRESRTLKNTNHKENKHNQARGEKSFNQTEIEKGNQTAQAGLAGFEVLEGIDKTKYLVDELKEFVTEQVKLYKPRHPRAYISKLVDKYIGRFRIRPQRICAVKNETLEHENNDVSYEEAMRILRGVLSPEICPN